MSATAAPFGLRPTYHLSGIVHPFTTPGGSTIASAYANNIYQNSPVSINAAGNLIQAAAATPAVGSFQGVEYTLTADGRRHVGNLWPGGSVATEIVAYYTFDPAILYEIQADATVAQTAMGAFAEWTANGTNNGSLVTGFSSVALATASVIDTILGLQIVGLANYVDNAWGDAFPILQVRVARHQLQTAPTFVPGT